MIKYPDYKNLNLSLRSLTALYKYCSLTVPVTVKHKRKNSRYFSLSLLVYAQLLGNLLLRHSCLKNLNLSEKKNRLTENEIKELSGFLFETCINDLAKAMFSKLKEVTARKRVNSMLQMLENYKLITIERDRGCLYLSFSEKFIRIYLDSSKDFFEISGDLIHVILNQSCSSQLISLLYLYEYNRKSTLKAIEQLCNKDPSLYKNDQAKLSVLQQIINKLSLPELQKFKEFILGLGISSSNICAYIDRGISCFKDDILKCKELSFLIICALSSDLKNKIISYINNHMNFFFKKKKHVKGEANHILIPEPAPVLSPEDVSRLEQETMQQFSALFSK